MIALLLGAWLLCSSAAAETVRIGLFVGNNIGYGGDETLVYAEQEARDMARLFQNMGAMSRERVYLLTGERRAVVHDTILQIEAQAREISARGDEVMLVFFYSGHASSDGLHLSGDLLPMDFVRRWLEQSVAQIRIAFVDACESGGLARARGGTPIDAVELVVNDKLTVSGLAIITSTGPTSVAREAASFGGGVFSQALISGLRGSADADSNGEITLIEAYEYVHAETVVGSVTLDSTVQRPERRFELEGVGSLALTRLPNRAAGLIFPEELEGTYKIVSVGNGQIVAQINKVPGEERRLALPTGRYIVRKARREDVLLAEVDLAWGGERWLDESQMDSVALGDPLARGGWNLRPFRLSGLTMMGSPLQAKHPYMAGAAVEARYLIKPSFGLVAIGDQSRGTKDLDEIGELFLESWRLGAGLTYERHLPRLDLSASAGLQVTRFHQHLEHIQVIDGDVDGLVDQTRGTTSPGLWSAAGMHLPLGPTFGLNLMLRGNLYQSLVDDQPTTLVDGQALLGLSANFGGSQIARAQRRSD